MSLTQLLPIHPFPARMAPEIALASCASLRRGSIVLDPMAGSGTVLRVAAEHGHEAMGFDMDPLSVLMSRVWTARIDPEQLRVAGEKIVDRASSPRSRVIRLDWIDGDPDTRAFINYWFGRQQQADLRRISGQLRDYDGALGDALRLALSRIIITKDRGASLARDVSHSRPHRVLANSDFPVVAEFSRSIRRLAARLEDQPPPGRVRVGVGDARSLAGVRSGSVDAVITSPPYLNAIDYLRGHRLALVWLGYGLGDLQIVRSESIGAERRPNADADRDLADQLTASLGALPELPNRIRRMVERYALDVYRVLNELHRVIRSGGKAVLVIGNSCLKGVFVENALVVITAAERAGFQLAMRNERPLPPSRRYLPPPNEREASDLQKRMRTESVLTFAHA